MKCILENGWKDRNMASGNNGQANIGIQVNILKENIMEMVP